MTPIEHLESEDWKEYPDQFKPQARCFYKRFETPTRCHCNDDKWGMQVVIAVWHDAIGDTYTFEMDVQGELPDGTWIKLKQWGLPRNLPETLAKIKRLLATWEFAANHE